MSETEIKKEVEQEVRAEELDTKGDPSAPANLVDLLNLLTLKMTLKIWDQQ